jgi:hypothetical protein
MEVFFCGNRPGAKSSSDIKHLARVVPFDLEILRSRFENELKPYLGNPQRESLTLQLWIDAIKEERASASAH